MRGTKIKSATYLSEKGIGENVIKSILNDMSMENDCFEKRIAWIKLKLITSENLVCEYKIWAKFMKDFDTRKTDVSSDDFRNRMPGYISEVAQAYSDFGRKQNERSLGELATLLLAIDPDRIEIEYT